MPDNRMIHDLTLEDIHPVRRNPVITEKKCYRLSIQIEPGSRLLFQILPGIWKEEHPDSRVDTGK